jgi:hypothetical protein
MGLEATPATQRSQRIGFGITGSSISASTASDLVKA